MIEQIQNVGIVGYAGLDKSALIESAKKAFALNQPVAERFDMFLPLFPAELAVNMSYLGDRASAQTRVSPTGFSIDPDEYHRALSQQMPELYTGANRQRVFDYEDHFRGGIVTVDRAWARRFPQYAPFMGEKLELYLLGGGPQAFVVPQSVYPRGYGVLDAFEKSAGIADTCAAYRRYVAERVSHGNFYVPEAFEAEYLQTNSLEPVSLTQSEIARAAQELSVLKLARGDCETIRFYTDIARSAAEVSLYEPFARACDLFEEVSVTRDTMMLTQLYYSDDEEVGDIWTPARDVGQFIDHRQGVLDARAYCRYYQIAPRPDSATGGGRYPDRLRAVTVRRREMPLRVAEARNNPAYGPGAGDTRATYVYLPNSGEMLHQRWLIASDDRPRVQNTAVSPEEYAVMTARAVLQEWKGQLADAMYIRETALWQMQPGSDEYERARMSLNWQVSMLTDKVASLGARYGVRRSSYDDDIDYLRRMADWRDGMLADGDDAAVDFSPIEERERSIECGFAMRCDVRGTRLLALAKQNRGNDWLEGSAASMGDDAAAPFVTPDDDAPKTSGEKRGDTPKAHAAPEASYAENTLLMRAEEAERADDAEQPENTQTDTAVKPIEAPAAAQTQTVAQVSEASKYQAVESVAPNQPEQTKPIQQSEPLDVAENDSASAVADASPIMTNNADTEAAEAMHTMTAENSAPDHPEQAKQLSQTEQPAQPEQSDRSETLPSDAAPTDTNEAPVQERGDDIEPVQMPEAPEAADMPKTSESPESAPKENAAASQPEQSDRSEPSQANAAPTDTIEASIPESGDDFEPVQMPDAPETADVPKASESSELASEEDAAASHPEQPAGPEASAQAEPPTLPVMSAAYQSSTEAIPAPSASVSPTAQPTDLAWDNGFVESYDKAGDASPVTAKTDKPAPAVSPTGRSGLADGLLAAVDERRKAEARKQAAVQNEKPVLPPASKPERAPVQVEITQDKPPKRSLLFWRKWKK